jgi:hypothetical protein
MPYGTAHRLTDFPDNQAGLRKIEGGISLPRAEYSFWIHPA